MDSSDLEIPAFFTTNGEDIWKLRWFAFDPMCELENMETHKKKSFAMGGITAQGFKRLRGEIELLKRQIQ